MSQPNPNSQSQWEQPPDDGIGYDCWRCMRCVHGGDGECRDQANEDLHTVDVGPDGPEIRCRAYYEAVIEEVAR